MRIYGLDFTSAPSKSSSTARRQKRLMLAACTLENDVLTVNSFECLNGGCQGDFSNLEAQLRIGGEWIAGLDFPFGQPARLIRDLNWPEIWADYVAKVEDMGKEGFERALTFYKGKQPEGQKEHYRETDCKAGAISPMKLYGVPVGKMFFQGAPRLLHSDISIRPVRITAEKRQVIEAYPAMVARKCFDNRTSYKNDNPNRNTVALKNARRKIVETICSSDNPCMNAYGIRVEMGEFEKDICINDFSGDHLDSVLCAIQAAWSYSRRDDNYGIPLNASILEGWICDPATLDGIDT